jgi:putative nucleotidyltransferase with HDIG domain
MLYIKDSRGAGKMERQEMLELVKEKINNKNLVNHCLAVEAIMKALAAELNKRAGNEDLDEEKWATAGLVHDIDYAQTADDPQKHALIGAQLLEEMGFDEDIVHAVKAHNEIHGVPLESKMDIALYAADPISGLIVAAALIRPEKKLKAVNTRSVLKRFNEKAFARGANREQIMECQKIGLTLEEFIEISLSAMQGIDSEIGL